MTAAGLLLSMLGVALIYSGITGNDLRDVIPNVLSGKPAADGARKLSPEAAGKGGSMSPGGGGGSGGSGGGGIGVTNSVQSPTRMTV
jgi:hypothetical protein